MRTDPLTSDDLAASVIAVPPLCRRPDLSLATDENKRLIQHLETGGVRILLYGGNANLYHIALSEYESLLALLKESAGSGTAVIPSAGPSFGAMMDQAQILRGAGFPTAMILPTTFPAAEAGVQLAVRQFAERAEMPVVLYLKDDQYLSPTGAAELVDDGIVSLIKYAVVRDDPADDPILRDLVDRVPPSIVVSGIGEQPAPAHLATFGLAGFTSGCVCVAPRLSTAVRRALAEGDRAETERLVAIFRPLEDLRNTHGPIPVLHHAVAAAGIADTGPILPLLASLPAEPLRKTAAAAIELAAAE